MNYKPVDIQYAVSEIMRNHRRLSEGQLAANLGWSVERLRLTMAQEWFQERYEHTPTRGALKSYIVRRESVKHA